MVQEMSQCHDPGVFLKMLKDQKGFGIFFIRLIGWGYVIRLIILISGCKDRKISNDIQSFIEIESYLINKI